MNNQTKESKWVEIRPYATQLVNKKHRQPQGLWDIFLEEAKRKFLAAASVADHFNNAFTARRLNVSRNTLRKYIGKNKTAQIQTAKELGLL